MKKILFCLIGAIALLVAIAYFSGTSLPEQSTITRSVKLNMPPQTVWAQLYDFNQLPEWHPHVASTEKLETHPELPHKWRITLNNGNQLTVENIFAQENALLTTKIIDSSLSLEGNWIFEMKPFGNDKTLLILTENISVPRPFMRLYLFLKGNEASVEETLSHLATSLGEPNAAIEE